MRKYFLGVIAAFALVVTVADAATFTRDLTIGSTGSDVVALQDMLIASGDLVIPAGVSKGYFGPLTQSALAKWQAKMGISPAAGYFGPITRAKVEASGQVGGGSSNNNDDDSSDLSGGEASLESYEFSAGDDSDIEEGASGEVAEIEFDVEDGDVMIDRVDLAFENASTSDSTDLWDVLESVQLIIDGEEVGSADLSDEDEYLDEDDGTVRISGIDYKVDEGETVTIVVEVTVQDNVDSDDQDTFTVYVVDDGIRATDAEGIQQYIDQNASSETVDFDIEVAGADDELNVSSSSEDPEADTLKVEDSQKSDQHAIFAFDLEAEENDIEIDTVTVTVAVGTSTVSDIYSDLALEIDGEEFDDWSYVSGTAASATRQVAFDIDGDYTLDADSEVTVVLMAEFKAADGSNYNSGATTTASIDDAGVEGEGADDIESDGTADGEIHTLSTEGIVVPASGVETTTDTQGDNDTVGIFTIDFEVTAFEEDFYIADLATTTASVSTGGVEFTSMGSGTSSATLSSTADEDTTGVFTVKEGETETFTLTVTFDPTTAGQYRLVLDEIWASENTDGVTDSVVKVLEETDFRTAYENIN